MRSLLILIALCGPALADTDGGVVIHTGMTQVGRWSPMNLGFRGEYGVRMGDFAVYGEGEIGSLWAASWHHGSIDTGMGDGDISGSLMRLGVAARYTFAKSIGAWSKRHERMENHFYVEGSLDEGRVSVDDMGSVWRREYGIGIGYLMWGSLASGSHLAGVYGIRFTVAPGLNTPNVVPAPLGETGARDIGVSFDFGLLFGG